ncbi:MAG: MipA/OmpV family protein [bacterium]|nr:MipA/OmpV family protein [bacterium]
MTGLRRGGEREKPLLAYLLDRKQALILLVQCAVLGNGIKDSPLVDRSIEPMILTGYLYRFR